MAVVFTTGINEKGRVIVLMTQPLIQDAGCLWQVVHHWLATCVNNPY